MKFPKLRVLTGGLVLLAAGSPIAAESINPATTPQTAPMNAQEKKNLQLVLDWSPKWWKPTTWNWQVQYQSESYIQHNPNINPAATHS